MASWVVITVGHLNEYLVGAQGKALRSAALAPGQVDPFPAVMSDRCNYIRNRISSRVQISATEYSIPPELKTAAAMLIIEALSVRLSAALELTEDQKSMVSRAYKDLDIAGTKDLSISAADDAVTAPVQNTAAVEIARAPRQVVSRESLGGLL